MVRSKTTLSCFIICITFHILVVCLAYKKPYTEEFQHAVKNEKSPLGFQHLLHLVKNKNERIDAVSEILRLAKNGNKLVLQVHNAKEEEARQEFQAAGRKLNETMKFTINKSTGEKKRFHLHKSILQYDLEFLEYAFKEKILRSIAQEYRKTAEDTLKPRHPDLRLSQKLLEVLILPSEDGFEVGYEEKLVTFRIFNGKFTGAMQNFLSLKQLSFFKRNWLTPRLLKKNLNTKTRKRNFYEFLKSLHELLLLRSQGMILRALASNAPQGKASSGRKKPKWWKSSFSL